ncbi:MAG: hypothetical protein FJW23_02965 [Acidimicrobiia bacterium]|nr:hypothetical protein [Acidimicrobiia bacterium]
MRARSQRSGTVLLVALVVTVASVLPRAQIIEQVVVKVNGEIVTKSEFEQRQVALLRQRPELAGGNVTNDVLRRAVEEVTPGLILNVVDELLLVQRGRELGYVLGDEQFASIVENIKQENRIESDADFQAALAQESMTMAELRRNMERQMLVSQVQSQEIRNRISVTEEEARAYYDENREAFSTPAEVTLREILIGVAVVNDAVNVAEDEAARAEAAAVHERLLKGEPFPRLAGEVSDSPSKANGGLIGPFRMNDLAPPLQALIDGLEVGDVASPIRVSAGYQILKLESRSPREVQSFAEARPAIAERVSQEKLGVEIRKFVDRLRSQAIVQWRNEELKKAYDIALEQRSAITGTAQ